MPYPASQDVHAPVVGSHAPSGAVLHPGTHRSHGSVLPPGLYIPEKQGVHNTLSYPGSQAVHNPVVASHTPGAESHPTEQAEHESSVPPVLYVPAAHAVHAVVPYPASHAVQVPSVGSHVPGGASLHSAGQGIPHGTLGSLIVVKPDSGVGWYVPSAHTLQPTVVVHCSPAAHEQDGVVPPALVDESGHGVHVPAPSHQ